MRVAVLELSNKAGASPEDVASVATVLRDLAGEVLPLNRFSVMAREDMFHVLPEARMPEDCNGTCEVLFGHRLEAHFLVIGEVSEKSDGLVVTMRLLDTVSGEPAGRIEIEGREISAMRGAIEARGRELLGEILRFARLEEGPEGDEAAQAAGEAVAVPPAKVHPESKLAELKSQTAKSVRKGKVFKSAFGTEMVTIPAGTFVMGSPEDEPTRERDEPQHWVTIPRAFQIGRYEVTQKLWKDVIGGNPSHFRSCGDRCPVENVSWYEAIRFCNRLSEREGLDPAYAIDGDKVTWDRTATGYRLPTEAEWEYACRAGTESAFYTGIIREIGCRDDPSFDRAGWYCGNASKMTHSVGRKESNRFGLYDMHGNVWEWCWDWYKAYPKESVVDQGGPDMGSHKVFRGGSWFDYAMQGRSAYRFYFTPSYRYEFIGMRLCRSAG